MMFNAGTWEAWMLVAIIAAGLAAGFAAYAALVLAALIGWLREKLRGHGNARSL